MQPLSLLKCLQLCTISMTSYLGCTVFQHTWHGCVTVLTGANRISSAFAAEQCHLLQDEYPVCFLTSVFCITSHCLYHNSLRKSVLLCLQISNLPSVIFNRFATSSRATSPGRRNLPVLHMTPTLKGRTREESIVLTCVWVQKDTARWYPCSFKWKNDIAGVAGGHLATHPVLRVGHAAWRAGRHPRDKRCTLERLMYSWQWSWGASTAGRLWA